LVVGKPLGIVAFSWAAVRLGLANLPNHVSWRLIAAVGLLAGIGFTVSIFISSLAFNNDALLTQAKAAVLGASVVAGIGGFIGLRRSIPKEGPAVLEASANA